MPSPALLARARAARAVGRAAFEEATARFDVGLFVDAFAGHLEESRRGPLQDR